MKSIIYVTLDLKKKLRGKDGNSQEATLKCRA